jgi:DNA-binding transcriptional ArsR family regulator
VLHAHDGTMTAGDLAGRFSHSWPTTTRHLGVLTAAGLIRVEAHGRERHYLLDRRHLRDVAGLWFGSLGLDLGDAADRPDDPEAAP